VACYLYDPCERCEHCVSGRHTLCASSRRLGYERDGGLAEFVAVPAANLLPFDDALDFELAAVAMDAVLSPWHALVDRAGLRAGGTLAIVGAGGLGLNGVQVAAGCGARVAVVEVNAERREAALGFGAELAVEPEGLDTIREWSDGGAQVVFEAAGTRA